VETSRGIITDRNGKILVSNREIYTVSFDPDLVPDQDGETHQAAVARALPETAWRDEDIEPMYLRPCDAVDNLSSIAAKRGDDPAQAHAELRRLLNVSPERP